MNTLQSGNNDLVNVDYSDLLDKILQVLKTSHSQDLFEISNDKQRLLIKINEIANKVIELSVNNPLGSSSNSAKTASVNFSPGFAEKFPKQIEEIRDCLEVLLKSQVEKKSLSIHQFVEQLTTDLQDFKGQSSSLDFTYNFQGYHNLQKQRLTVSGKGGKAKEILRFHKLTISVQKTKEFSEQLRAGLEKYIKAEFAEESETQREDLFDVLDDLYQDKDKSESDFYKLRQIIDRETLGKLKKQAQINYLEFLHENLNLESGNNAQAAIYLQDTIRRLRLIDEYINDINKADGDYLVNYAGVELNYRDIFSRGEAFDMLPIIAKIEGYLGETKDDEKGEIQFILGLKLKFDGKVQAYGGQNVFEYYLNLLNPDSKEHQEELNDVLRKKTFARKVLKIVFIYYLMFAYRPNSTTNGSSSNWELEYNPIPGFDKKVIPILKGDDDEAKKELFKKIIKGFEQFEIYNKVRILKQSLINLIKSSKRNFPTREYPLHISVAKTILEEDIEEILEKNTFFKSVLRGNPKLFLKYISIGAAKNKTNTFYSLPAKISISDIHYASSDELQSFNMEYNIEKIRALPILFLPFADSKCKSVYNQHLKKNKVILFPYRLENPQLAPQKLFIYNFTFSLLSYIALKVLLKQQKRLFIPILRLHLHNKEDNAPIEKLIVSLSKSLSHLLNEEHRSNAQGIDIRSLTYKLPNVFSSLYSVLPKKFTFNDESQYPKIVDKLAIIIISSRESDRSWKSNQKISNVMGEILGFTCNHGTARIQLIKTFSENYEQQKIFTEPTVIIDEVAKLYQKGYRRFIYIAKAPYTSSLYMTQKEDDDGLFFMSKEVIRSLKSTHDNIKIYPMFFDKYYANKFHNIKANCLYIKDTVELTNIVDDPSKKSIVFFNLFNGFTVGKGDERNYNGVISYATFANIYKDILDDEDIYRGLIFNGDLKNEILQLLTLFHFSRYEKAKEINLKLNPYENLIGDYSVGKLSLFNHMRGKSFFNLLAFLTEANKILNVDK